MHGLAILVNLFNKLENQNKLVTKIIDIIDQNSNWQVNKQAIDSL